MAEYLVNPKAPFFFPDPDAGPDIVFFVELTQRNSNETLRMPVFVQTRFTNNLEAARLAQAISKTNPTEFYKRKDGTIAYKNIDRKERILEFCKERYHLALLVCYPYEANYDAETTTGEHRFFTLIDGNNINTFLKTKQIEFLKALKNNDMLTKDYYGFEPLSKRLKFK